MISVDEAKALISRKCKVNRTEVIPIEESFGYVLAKDIQSPVDTPPFDNSAMDGYAFHYASWDGLSPIRVVGEVQAGSVPEYVLARHEAVRIFTGAVVPGSADTVVMQEKVEVEGDEIFIRDEQLTMGRNIREKGSQTKAGELALPEGHRLVPASISFLAGLGIDKVNVYARPEVAIIVTGKELVPPGTPLKRGEIYESNGYGLSAACQSLQIEPMYVDIVKDDVSLIENSIRNASDADIIILTGGASVGDYDLVPAALQQFGAEKVFHMVSQRPGKPFYFGTHSGTLIFGLPGNPAAVLTSFYQFIVPAIEAFTHKPYFPRKKMILANSYTKKPQLTYFLKGKTSGDQVEILDHQQSYLVNSFAHADCLITLEEGRDRYDAGDEVEVLLVMG